MMDPSLKSIPLIVPRRLTALADQCASVYKCPVEVRPYNKLSQQLYRKMFKEQAIVVGPGDKIAEWIKGQKASTNGKELVGRILVLDDEAPSAHHKELEDQRAIDFFDAEPTPANWSFKINRFLAEFERDAETAVLREELIKKENDLNHLNEIGMALSTEKDLSSLLEMIVLKSREMTSADGGSLYLIEADPNIPDDPKDYFKNKKMRFQVAQNDSRDVPFKSFLVDISKSSVYGYVALTQEHLNFDDAYELGLDHEYRWGGKEFDASTNYRTKSMLTVPMINWRGDTIGVIQLINRKRDPKLVLGEPAECIDDIEPFTERDVQMTRSIASQASIAIQNTQLVDSIKGLFEGFISASVKAIESRDPTTSGHSQRVATLTIAIAEKVDQSRAKDFKEVKFTPENLDEIRYASLLHDFGKIGVREHVLVKAKKLYPEEMQAVQDRFELIRRTVALEHAEAELKLLESAQDKATSQALERYREKLSREIAEIDEIMDFITQCNEPTVLAGGGFERLSEIASRSFYNSQGQPVSFISDKERISLSVPKGSLNENDRKEIESHVTHTYKFLTTIPWTGELRNVPQIAYAHHEKLDGSGYPNRLTEAEIPIQSKMMTISDIYDALTAMDRPYKKALPAERALNILVEESKAHHVDKALLDLFIAAEIYKLVIQQA